MFGNVKHALALAALCSCAAMRADAGAWVPGPDSGYHKLALNFFHSDDAFQGAVAPEEFSNLNLSYYGEVGLLPRVALYGTAALTRLEQETYAGDSDFFGVGDVDVGLRFGLIEEPFVLSAAFLFKAPYLYEANRSLPPGNGQEDFEWRLLAGKSLNEWGYVGFESAYRLRLGDPSDELRFLLEYGVALSERAYFRTKLDIIESLNNGDSIDQGIGNPTLNPEFDLGRIELTAGWNLSPPEPVSRAGRFGLEFTYTRDLYGENTLRGNTVQFGVTYAY